jgi:hypothetical protein
MEVWACLRNLVSTPFNPFGALADGYCALGLPRTGTGGATFSHGKKEIDSGTFSIVDDAGRLGARMEGYLFNLLKKKSTPAPLAYSARRHGMRS